MQATQLCHRCGYDLPGDAHDCPECQDPRPAASRAARQVAGVDPPTRSVHPLTAVRPARESPVGRPLRHPSWARDLSAFTALLGLLSAAGALVSIVAHIDRFSVQLSPIILERLDLAVVVLIGATGAAAAATLLALVGRAVRVLGRRRHRSMPPGGEPAPPGRR